MWFIAPWNKKHTSSWICFHIFLKILQELDSQGQVKNPLWKESGFCLCLWLGNRLCICVWVSGLNVLRIKNLIDVPLGDIYIYIYWHWASLRSKVSRDLIPYCTRSCRKLCRGSERYLPLKGDAGLRLIAFWFGVMVTAQLVLPGRGIWMENDAQSKVWRAEVS